MNQWPNGQPSMFSQQTAMFPNAGPQFDMNSPFAQMPNGGSANGFPGQTFQPGSVVPAKRPHDGMSGSPQQMSRSQTPNYGAFANAQAGAQHFQNAPTPFQHLQQSGSNNATPSPTMSNQQFRPGQPGMANASPSPYPPSQTPQQGGNFGGQMSPGTQQNPNQGLNMAQQVQGWNQGMPGMNNANMAMTGMSGSMPTQMNNNAMGAQNMNAQRAYQLKLLQHQQQLRASGMMGPMGAQAPNQMNNFAAMQQQQQQSQQQPQQPQQQPQQQHSQAHAGMMNGQAMNPAVMNTMNMSPQQQAQAKRAQFLKTLAGQAAQQGRQINMAPQISGRNIDLYMLWTVVVQAGAFQTVERNGQWQAVANKLALPQQQFPTAAEELKQIYISTLAQYERMWLAMRAQQKQEQARQHAHQMAGLGGPQQASPTKPMMQPQSQGNQFSQFPPGVPQGAPQVQPPTPAQMQAQSHATPVQANAQLPQNGASTPQSMLQHRRNSGVRRPEQMTPQALNAHANVQSPHGISRAQTSLSIKQEPPESVVAAEEPRSTNYEPVQHPVEQDGGYDVPALFDLGAVISRLVPNMPAVDEMGVIDTKAITLSLASGIHSEVRYALDMLAIISHDPRISFDLEKCDDLIDVILDCAAEQTDTLASGAADTSTEIDVLAYEDVLRAGRAEAEAFQDVPEYGSQEYEKARAAERTVAITTILRNFSFFECNHVLLTAAPVIKWLSNTIRLIGTRTLFLRTALNTQDFYKDIITFLSNITQSLELPSRDDALHIMHFLLAFAPQPRPTVDASTPNKLRFSSFVPTTHRYLPPAVDCLAKLLARQDPNRTFYRSIFSSQESGPSLLTRAFGLAISVLPDRSRGALSNNMQLRIVEARKAYLSQGMLAADILSALIPGSENGLARMWIESEDGWAVSLLNLAALLSVDRTPQAAGHKGREMAGDGDGNKLITHRALAMIKRLTEKSGKSQQNNQQLSNGHTHGADSDDEGADVSASSRWPKWEGIPHGHAVLGALMLPNTDRVALGLLCGLHEMAMQATT